MSATTEASAAPPRLDRMSFGQWLRGRRAGLGVSQRQLAQRTGLNNAYLAQIESGVRPPSVKALLALAREVGPYPPDILESVDLERVLPRGREFVELILSIKHKKSGQSKEEEWRSVRNLVEQHWRIRPHRKSATRLTTPAYPRWVAEEKAWFDLNHYFDAHPQHEPSLRVPVCAIGEWYGLWFVEKRWQAAESIYGTALGVALANGLTLLNETQGERVRRFTVAHEIGHVRMETGDEPVANWYAAALLVPLRVLNVLVSRGIPHSDELADLFGVSAAVIVRRLQELKCTEVRPWSVHDAELAASRYLKHDPLTK